MDMTKEYESLFNSYKEDMKYDPDSSLSDEILDTMCKLKLEYRSEFTVSLSEVIVNEQNGNIEPTLVDFYGNYDTYDKLVSKLLSKTFSLCNTGEYAVGKVPFTFDDCNMEQLVIITTTLLFFNCKVLALLNIDEQSTRGVISSNLKNKPPISFYFLIDLDNIVDNLDDTGGLIELVKVIKDRAKISVIDKLGISKHIVDNILENMFLIKEDNKIIYYYY